MGRTPDRQPGESLEEGMLFENRGSGEDPSVLGGLRFVQSRFRAYDEFGVFNLRPIFGREYQFAASEAASSTTSNTYKQKLRLTTPALQGGDYLIIWHALVTTASANKDFQARVQVDDATTLTEIQYRNAIANHDYALGGFAQVTLSAAVHNIDIDYSSLVGSSTSISEARIAIWRVG